jgi:hypothetical protein
MVVNLHGRSADVSRIVQARLSICAAMVTQFVTHLMRPRHSVRASWQSLEFRPDTKRRVDGN